MAQNIIASRGTGLPSDSRLLNKLSSSLRSNMAAYDVDRFLKSGSVTGAESLCSSCPYCRSLAIEHSCVDATSSCHAGM